MAPYQAAYAPNLHVFLKSLKDQPIESSIEYLIALLKRRQIRSARPCAVATAQLLLRVVAKFRWTDVGKLLTRIQEVGQRLTEAQPKEMAVGNIVRRVLGMIREEAKESRNDDNSQSDSPSNSTVDLRGHAASSATMSPLRNASIAADLPEAKEGDHERDMQDYGSRPPLMTSHTSYAVLNGLAVQQSMFNLLSATPSPMSTPPGAQSPIRQSAMSPAFLSTRLSAGTQDLKAEIISGIEEIIDELLQVDDQIAAYAQEHIHSNEIILTHSSSRTVQKFLLKAAEKRKFTVIHAESFPNDHEETNATIMGTRRNDSDDADELSSGGFQKPLTAAGITVVVITDAAVFAMMSRVNKVILATHAVIANGGLVAAAGARIIAKAAHRHRTPVIVVSGIYKLSPEYPFEFESLIEYGDTGKIISYEDGDLVDKLDVDNPLFDYVPPELVDLYITNLGAHAPSYLYRIVADHYNSEDIKLDQRF
ncbi:MAG: GCD complex subunit gcd7 [Claussenomyces sp. TS43310]|nr:MAG: GCD complex subunit gcd7 [Claussenomyces sp. TS43310]